MRIIAIAAVAALSTALGASAEEIKAIAVVTQVQGATQYRTSLTISNANPVITTTVVMRFSYRSPVDASFQVVDLDAPPLGPHRIQVYEDIIQEFKDAGRIRAADMNAGLFGTLLVRFDDLTVRAEAGAVARTYNNAAGGGTVGIAYAGRCY
jgi:hypothetical protein